MMAMSDTGAGGRLRAGVGRSDITTDQPGAIIHDPLYAKALVIDDGTTSVAIVAMDVVALAMIGEVPDDFVPTLRARIEGELGIPGAHVLVNASHTHPPGSLLCPPDELLERVTDAVASARQSMVPVTVGSGVGYEDRFIINRTLRLKDGTGWTIRHANPCPPDELVQALGPVDPQIGVIRVDRSDGGPLAVVYNFGCHPLLGVPGGFITGNFPAFASEVIEQHLGAGTLALFLQGAGGDICEVLYKDVSHPRDCREPGRMLGLSTLQAWRQITTADATISVAHKILDLPRRTDIPQRLAALEAEQDELLASLRFTSLNFRTFLPLYLKYALNPDWPADYSYRYLQEEAIGRSDLREMDAENRRNLEKYLSNIRTMERLARIQDQIATLRKHQEINAESGEATIRTEVQGMRIGQCVLITSPAELLAQVGLNIKAASPYEHTFVLGFSNGYIHYGPPASDYALGGYEVTECLLAPEWQELYEQAAREVIAML